MKTPSKYPKAMIVMHWLTVVLLIFVFIKGQTVESLDFNAENMNTFRSHAIPGMLILILTLIRLFVKNKNKNNFPEDIKYFSSGHKLLVNTVNKLMYVLLIITPLIGFIMVYKTGALAYDFGGAFPDGASFNETLEVLHKVFVFTLLGVVALHILGVIIYKIKTGNNLLKRMCILLK